MSRALSRSTVKRFASRSGTQLLAKKAGQEAFQSITRTYFKGAMGALLIYDITRRESFDHVVNWLNEVKNNSSKEIVVVLIGNKSDLDDKYFGK